MYTNRLKFILILSIIFISAPWMANAGTVTLAFTGVNGINDGYVYFDPYYGKINNGPTINIWCVDYCHPSDTGTQWTVNVTSTASTNFGNTYLGNKTEYLAIVWLINQYERLPNVDSAPTLAQLEFQYAIWSFSGWSTSDQTLLNQVGALKATALSAAANGYNPSGWVILTDVNGGQQEFMAQGQEQVPEPSLMLLMLIGLSAVCVYCYRTGRAVRTQGISETGANAA
jgi:hypothetical protein